jgi:glyoxylase-like metal-dependent hydrolase (beta-lactamase superfamily II)
LAWFVLVTQRTSKGQKLTMIFRQLFEPVSSTYTYLLACESTGQALLIDPVVNAIDRDLLVLRSLGSRWR